MEKRRDLLQECSELVHEINGNKRDNEKAQWEFLQELGLRRDKLGHLSRIDHDISHGESSDEDRCCDDSRDPWIMLS